MKVTENQLLKYGQNETRDKRAADNGRFGVMAALAPQKRQCKFERLYPAGSVVEAATTPSRLDVGCNAQKHRRESSVSERVYNPTTQWDNAVDRQKKVIN